MQRLIIKHIRSDHYFTLMDADNGDVYTASFDFINVESLPEIGDMILLPEENIEYTQKHADGQHLGFLCLGPYSPQESCIRHGHRINGTDVVVVVKPDRTFLLHRYWG